MYVENRTKIANLPTHPMYLTLPMKGFPVEFGIGVSGPNICSIIRISFYAPNIDPSQTLARGPRPNAEEYPAPFGSDPYLPNV